MRWRVWITVGAVAVVLIIAGLYAIGRGEDLEEIPLSQVIAEAQSGNVDEIQIDGSLLTILMNDGREFRSRKEEDTTVVDVLLTSGVKVGGEDGVILVLEGRGLGNWIGIIITFSPMLLLVGGFMIFAVRWATRRN